MARVSWAKRVASRTEKAVVAYMAVLAVVWVVGWRSAQRINYQTISLHDSDGGELQKALARSERTEKRGMCQDCCFMEEQDAVCILLGNYPFQSLWIHTNPTQPRNKPLSRSSNKRSLIYKATNQKANHLGLK